MSVRSARWILTLAVVLAGLPFLNQAFHIDDRIYLEVARHAAENPLFPYDYAPLFEGLVTPDAASHSHLPLTSYYLAIIRGLAGGEREWAFHSAFLIFPWIAVISFHDLARRRLRNPLAAALLLLVSPAFFLLSHTLMTEVPSLAFWLLAISRFERISAGEAGRWDHLLCAAGLLGASLISLLSAGLVLLLAAHLLLTRGREGFPGTPRLLLLLALPVSVWILWYGIGYLHYGRFLLVRTALHMEKRDVFSAGLMLTKGISFLLDMGGAVLFPLALWWGFRGRRAVILAGLVFAGCLAGLTLYAEDWTFPQALLAATFAASGVTALARFVWRCLGNLKPSVEWKTPHSDAPGGAWLPILWLVGIFVSCILFYPSGSARYTLLAFPPFLLVWQSSLESSLSAKLHLQSRLTWLTVLLTVSWSLLVSHADYRFAGLYRDAAQTLVSDYSAPGRTIWFTAEWGFRYYMERAGARLVARVEVGPKPGDIIIKPRLSSPWVTLYDGDKYTRLLEQRVAHLATPVRILDHTSHAGFYSTAWGILPFSVTGGERWEWFNVFEVTRDYDGPIPEPDRHF